ncbi:MAG: ribonuclease H family protein [Flavobacteriales bacterium]|nr:ribonuclease H family protein [Flavobacteriales bacterium]MDW8409355.1 ribonuclease H family protein [Flavobacteriales bacterium]
MDSSKKNRFYTVWRGRKPGVYNTWAEAEAQVTGFPGALFRGFDSEAEALEAFKQEPPAAGSLPARQVASTHPGTRPRWGLAVDGSCNMVTGTAEYKGVRLSDGKILFQGGPFAEATNNIVEFLAIVHALAYCHKHHLSDMPVFSDSQTALEWVRRGQARTKIPRTENNQEVFELLKRAQYWLATHRYHNPLLKWDTAAWGEIPADFGRK